jgi:hypothetical protein
MPTTLTLKDSHFAHRVVMNSVFLRINSGYLSASFCNGDSAGPRQLGYSWFRVPRYSDQFYCLFYNAVSVSDYVPSIDRIIGE